MTTYAIFLVITEVNYVSICNDLFHICPSLPILSLKTLHSYFIFLHIQLTIALVQITWLLLWRTQLESDYYKFHAFWFLSSQTPGNAHQPQMHLVLVITKQNRLPILLPIEGLKHFLPFKITLCLFKNAKN